MFCCVAFAETKDPPKGHSAPTPVVFFSVKDDVAVFVSAAMGVVAVEVVFFRANAPNAVLYWQSALRLLSGTLTVERRARWVTRDISVGSACVEYEARVNFSFCAVDCRKNSVFVFQAQY
jgi:hypothetical protein